VVFWCFSGIFSIKNHSKHTGTAFKREQTNIQKAFLKVNILVLGI